ncbi:MAG TPA: cysteine rich repeat-containing protein [Rhizomicrobium sp.]|jgi:hypothetical protein|nr:cysteine rich repeat-containing protein [Rhizomicrobium sp.]
MRVAVILFFLGAAAPIALAGAPPQAKPDRPACAEYVNRYCADVPMGKGRRIACLAKHKAELNPACKKRLLIMQETFRNAQKQLEANRKLPAKQPKADGASSQPPKPNTPK